MAATKLIMYKLAIETTINSITTISESEEKSRDKAVHQQNKGNYGRFNRPLKHYSNPEKTKSHDHRLHDGSRYHTKRGP